MRHRLISIVSFSESRGGAAKAALKYFCALKKMSIPVQFVVVEKYSKDSQVIAPKKRNYYFHFLKRILALSVQKLQRSSDFTKHSSNMFSCCDVLKHIENSELVHLNWINNETIALEKIPNIKGKIIITLHDEWFYCGTEHYTLESKRFIEGYSVENRDVFGVDLDRLVWIRKKRALNAIKDRVIFTAPSNWMVDRANQSALLQHFDIRLIPNCLDTELYSPTPSDVLVDFGVTDQDRVILFGAVYGKNMGMKGFDLLQQALRLLKTRLPEKCNIVLVSFGGTAGKNRLDFGFRHVEIGHVSESSKLAELYSRADFTVVPSIVESFGQVAAESLACETPVIAFDSSGLKDIVIHKVNGYLATPHSIESLCEGMLWMLDHDLCSLRQLGENGRRHVVCTFSEDIVVEKLLNLYCEHAGRAVVFQ
ncbi:MAG: hypothetical protein BVN35_15525 [Proteobacteria bacterium ST_bin11]|nr:MAG: hypothetical protein BVN35_15525 [Proteobacteria bacterium ST_bin11]